jgi:hypothetical protein
MSLATKKASCPSTMTNMETKNPDSTVTLDCIPSAHIVDQPEVISPCELHIDPALEARTLRKFDRYLLPPLATILILCYLDRSNLGNAKASDAHPASSQLSSSSDGYR